MSYPIECRVAGPLPFRSKIAITHLRFLNLTPDPGPEPRPVQFAEQGRVLQRRHGACVNQCVALVNRCVLRIIHSLCTTARMIIRRRRTADFTVIGNELFRDERLRADEVGVLTYLRSQPDKWEVRRPALMRRWGLGRLAMRRIIHNLVRTGWIHALRLRRAGGTYVLYVVQDQPGPELSSEKTKQVISLEPRDGWTCEDASEPI